PEDPRPDTVARLPQPERLLTLHGAVTLPRPVTLRRFELARAVLLAAFVVGLAASISLAQLALTGLLLWVLLARWQGMLGALRWPLWPPIAAFAAWTLVTALVSARPLESLVESKGLLTLGTVLIVANVLPDAAAARKVASCLLVAV